MSRDIALEEAIALFREDLKDLSNEKLIMRAISLILLSNQSNDPVNLAMINELSYRSDS